WQAELRAEVDRRGGVDPKTFGLDKAITNQLLRELTRRGLRYLHDELVRRMAGTLSEDELEKLDADASDTLAAALARIKAQRLSIAARSRDIFPMKPPEREQLIRQALALLAEAGALPEPLLTPREAAELVAIGAEAVRVWCREGLGFYHRPSKCFFIPL